MIHRNGGDDCPVCGTKHLGKIYADRKRNLNNPCPQSVLNGIDAANEAAWNLELDPVRLPASARRRSFAQRLAEGFWLMKDFG